MTTRVVSIGADQPAELAWSRMQDKGIRHLVVTDNARLAGVLSERDLGGRNGGAVRRNRSVQELMSAPVASAPPQTTLREAANLMRGRMIGCLPVVANDRVVGIVTASDVLDELGRGFARPAAKSKRRTGASGIAAPRARREKGARPAMTAHIRAEGVPLDDGDRAYLQRKLAMKLGKFSRAVERASVRVRDVNGPRGGQDSVCRIKVVLRGLPSVVVEQQDASVQGAMDRALAGIERAVRRSVQRRRTRSRA